MISRNRSGPDIDEQAMNEAILNPHASGIDDLTQRILAKITQASWRSSANCARSPN